MYREFLALKLILKDMLVDIQKSAHDIFMDLRQATFDYPDIRNEEMINDIYENAETLVFIQEEQKEIMDILYKLTLVRDLYKHIELPKNICILPPAQSVLTAKKLEMADQLYLKISRGDECFDFLSSYAVNLFHNGKFPEEALNLYLDVFEEKVEDFNVFPKDILELTDELHYEMGEEWIVESKKPIEYWALLLEILFKTMGSDEEFIESIRGYPDSYEREM